MPYLSPKRILELHAAAQELGLDHDRKALFGGMPQILSALDEDPSPSKQLLLDLHALNSLPQSSPAEPCTLELWLENAIHLYQQHDPRSDTLKSFLKEVKQARQSPSIKPPLPPPLQRRWPLLLLAAFVPLTALLIYFRWPRCGNGLLDAGESCDDGNRVSWDGCSADCTREFIVNADAGVSDAGMLDAGDVGTSLDGGDAGANPDAADAATNPDAGKTISSATAKVRVTCKPGTITMINGSKQPQQCGQPPATAAMHKDFPKELEWIAPTSPPNADPAWKCKCETIR